jgi:hypothetical protein
MREEFKPLIKSFANWTDTATETKSIGLQADPAFGEGRRTGALFFARQLDCFIVTQNSQSLPGLVPSRQIIVTSGCSSVYHDWQKPRLCDTTPRRGRLPATQLNRRTVSVNG